MRNKKVKKVVKQNILIDNAIDYNKIDKEYKIEYIKSLIQNLNEQKKFIWVLISFNFVAIAFFIDKIFLNVVPNEYENYKSFLIVNIVIYFISAIIFMIWRDMIHRHSMKSTDLFITLDIAFARKTHFPGEEFWKKKGFVYITAYSFLWIGIFFTLYILLKSNQVL